MAIYFQVRMMGNLEWNFPRQHSGTAASQRQGPRFNSGLGSLSVWSLHILTVSAWVSSGCSGFLPQSKDVWIRLIDHAKLPLTVRGINGVNAWGYRDAAWVDLLSVQARWAE